MPPQKIYSEIFVTDFLGEFLWLCLRIQIKSKCENNTSQCSKWNTTYFSNVIKFYPMLLYFHYHGILAKVS